MQIPFTLCYLIYASNEPHSQCMDRVVSGLAVRPWFWGIGITDIVILAMFLITVPVLCCDCYRRCFSVMSCLWISTLVAAVIKILIWAIVDIVMFVKVVQPYCSGGIYAFNLASLIQNGLILVSCPCVLCFCVIVPQFDK